MNDSSRVSGGQRRCEGTPSSNLVELELAVFIIFLAKIRNLYIFIFMCGEIITQFQLCSRGCYGCRMGITLLSSTINGSPVASAQCKRSGDVIHPQLRCIGSGYETEYIIQMFIFLFHCRNSHLNPLYNIYTINTASASKVGNFRPFLGEVKKTKRSADEYFSFQIQECGSTTLETTLDAFCERSFNLLDATNAAI